MIALEVEQRTCGHDLPSLLPQCPFSLRRFLIPLESGKCPRSNDSQVFELLRRAVGVAVPGAVFLNGDALKISNVVVSGVAVNVVNVVACRDRSVCRLPHFAV